MEILNMEQWSPEWLEARKWVITGTKLKSVVSAKKDTRMNLIAELIAEKIAPKSESYKSEAMMLGNIKEEILKEEYPEYEDVWFIKQNDWIWLSPDGVKYEERPKISPMDPSEFVTHWGHTVMENVIVKALEVKSPEPKTFVKYAIDRWIPDEYFYQVVHYFVVIETLEELDFVIFTPEIFDPNFRKRVIHVTREELEDDIKIAKKALEDFRKEWLSTIESLILTA